MVGHTMVLCVHINIIKIIRRPWPSPAWVTNSRSRKERVRVLVEIKPEMLERDSEGPTGGDSDTKPESAADDLWADSARGSLSSGGP